MKNQIKRGSEWRKWDLHLHSPISFLNNDYNADWSAWVNAITQNEIAVIGLTNYFKFNRENGVNEIDIAKEKLKDTGVAIFPNLEYRIGQPNKEGDFINIHIVFSDKIASDKIDEFTTRLKLEDKRYCSDLQSKNDFESATVSKKDLENALKDNFVRGKDYLIVCVPNGYGGFRAEAKEGRSVAIATLYDKLADFFFARQQDTNYFLKTDRYENSIPKACIFCSDAHSINKIGDDYTWIKADVTYEGLKQIKYEPEQRVRIQQNIPEQKNAYQTIDKIKFIPKSGDDKIFGNQVIYFNQNLNSIIGGKSSGKSLLLHTVATTIDKRQVNRIERKLEFKGYNLACDFEVYWTDGTINKLNEDVEESNKKITYIPQLYINYLVEQNSKDELNKLVTNILKQDNDFKLYFENKIAVIDGITSSLKESAEKLIFALKKGISIRNELKEKGANFESPDSITKSIDASITNLQESYKLIQAKTKLSENELKEYQTLTEKKNKNNKDKELLDKDIQQINLVLSQAQKVYRDLFQENIGVLEDYSVNNSIKAKEIKDFLKSEFYNIIENIQKKIEILKLNDINELIINDQTKISKELEKYVLKLEGQKELETILKKIENEKRKREQVVELDKERKSYLKQYEEIKAKITNDLKTRLELYSVIKEKINTEKKEIGAEIKLEASVIIRKQKFQFYEQVSKNKISDDNYFYTLLPKHSDYVNIQEISTLFEKILYTDNSWLILSAKENLPLNNDTKLEDVYEGIMRDDFEFDFKITYQNDELLKMSPGKKGTVLLILFLKISTDDYPILIDQPEDNLDNRTIYNLLSAFIKEKKINRQIIIVSHNANLVVATDSENIIVANQEGQEYGNSNKEFKFEYVNGSLENSFHTNKIKFVLKTQGIKEHVCDILEGGEIAFKKREEKYGIVN